MKRYDTRTNTKPTDPDYLLYTDGTNVTFADLCQQLDASLNQIVGGEKQRSQYTQYNGLSQIHDVLILYINHSPIGCASFKEYKPGIAEVKRVFVQESARGNGYSKLLLQELEKIAVEKGYQSLILETGKPLLAARGLYHSLGFSNIPNYGPYVNMQESVCMEKIIKQ
ncbi:GNAT family N-acetyltransferase [Anaerosporobacter faecicola]|uniref:GNAT family N-acetyltransferase n=1 Tax=Anaerosporobacter faecicola TaxID=2718714 RepID=UPI00143C6ABB|nr:GNAT family N-acetyltransferase [Anaerosporobacter faecicola]